MSQNHQEALADLLDRWEECHDRHEPVTVEELCADCPHLAEELARQIEKLSSMSWMDGELRSTAEPVSTQGEFKAPDGYFHLLSRLGAGSSLSIKDLVDFLGSSGIVDDKELTRRRRSQRGATTAEFVHSLRQAQRITGFQATVLLSDQPSALLVGGAVILAQLGDGGMGQVLLAADRRRKKFVALKFVPRGLWASAPAVQRFLREFQVVQRLSHPNIVQVHDAVAGEGLLYLVMEAVSGAPLSRLADAEELLLVGDACELVRQAAQGLQHAHDCGVIHRDVKPSNIMLSAGGVVKVLDFGLVRARPAWPEDDSLTGADQVIGTFDYLPPELTESSAAAAPPSDIYSLGCTLYALLASHPPFSSQKRQGALQRVVARSSHPIPDIREVRPDVPAPLASLLRRMTANRPEDRLSSMSEVVEALAPFAADHDLKTLVARHKRIYDPAEEIVLETLVSRQRDKRHPASFKIGRLAAFASLILLSALILGRLSFMARYSQPNEYKKTGRQSVEVASPTRDAVVERAALAVSPQAAHETEEEIAERALRMGGRIALASDIDAWIETPDDLPDRPFKVVAADFSAARRRAFTDDDLETVARLPHLQKIVLSHSGVTDGGLAHLSQTPELREIVLDFTLIDGWGLGFLRALPKLERLSLRRLSRLSEAHLMPSSQFERLRSSSLESNKMTASGMEHIATLTHLTELDLYGTYITDEAGQLLGSLRELEAIHLGRTNVGDGTVRAIAKAPHLRDLNLRLTLVTDEALRILSHSQIEALDVSGTSVSAQGLAYCATMRDLVRLRIASLDITDDSLKPLRSLVQLEELFLRQTPIGNEGLRAISLLTNLRCLMICDTKVNDDGLRHLAGLSQLESLGLSITPVTDRGLNTLAEARLPRLETLFLKQLAITSKGLRRIKAAYPQCEIDY